MMFFGAPVGLLLLGVLPLLAWLLVRGVRRRTIVTSAFPALRERLLDLPLLPSGSLRRRRLQILLLLAGVALLALAAGGLTLGPPAAGPLKVVLVLDHLAARAIPGAAAPAGWQSVLATAGGVLDGLRRDDRVLVVRTDTGTLPGAFRSPGAAAALVAKLPAAELPLDRARTADLLRLLVQVHAPDAVVLVTADPARWRAHRPGGSAPFTVLRSAAAPAGGNLGIVAVEMRPELMSPGRLDLFCRVGFFAPGAGSAPIEATVEVRDRAAVLGSRSVRLAAGESRGLAFAGLRPQSGLLEIRLSPSDSFPSDNVFRAPVRERAFLTASLVSPGNSTLEAALRAIEGLDLTRVGSEADLGGPLPAVAVFDNVAPGRSRSNLLLVRPPSSDADLIVRGEVSRPGPGEAQAGEPVLEGVSFSGLTVSRLPVYLPPPSFRVVAKAGGYPLVMLGRNGLGRRVAVIGFDPLESGWQYDPSFPVLVANLVSWLGEETPGISSSHRVGDELAGEVLAGAVAAVGPDGESLAAPAPGRGSLKLSASGRYVLRTGSAGETLEVYVNLLEESVSRAMALEPADPGDPVPEALAARPLRYPMQGPLLVAALALLVAEIAIAPARSRGRLSG